MDRKKKGAEESVGVQQKHMKKKARNANMISKREIGCPGASVDSRKIDGAIFDFRVIFLCCQNTHDKKASFCWC